MKHYHFLIFSVVLLLAGSSGLLYGQHAGSGRQANTLEQQYENYISGALRFQVRADSLSRSANQKRRELGFTTSEEGRRELERSIVALERESFRVQRQADSLYTQARAIELRMITAARTNAGTSEAVSSAGQPVSTHENPQNRSENDLRSSQDSAAVSFLVLGEKDLGSWLTRSELSEAADLEAPFRDASFRMWQVSDLQDEKRNLQHQLDSGVSRRDRRRIERRIDEIDEKIFSLNMGALEIMQRANELRFMAASRFLDEISEEQHDPEFKKNGMKHQEFADESFRQAHGLRETADDLRSERYRQEYLLKAHEEELAAFESLEKAMDLYTTVADRAAHDDIPRRPDGRIDPGAALTRTSVDTPAAPKRTEARSFIDFGFKVLPETPYSAENPVPVNPELPGGLAYSVQLGLFNAGMVPGIFGGLTPLMSETEPGSHTERYSAGVFRNHAEAERGLVEINRQGFTDAFIVAYNNGTRIPVTRARQMERAALQIDAAEEAAAAAGDAHTEAQDMTVRDEAARTQGSLREAAAPADIEKAYGVTFRVQIAALSRMAEKSILDRWQRVADGKKVEYSLNNRGMYVYSTGIFNTFEEAVRVRDRFRQAGVPDAFIVPYRDDIRLSMEEATRLLNKQDQ